jgi:type II secretory pathway component PulC
VPVAPAPRGPTPPPAFLARRDVSRVLDHGPQDFLASVDEDPLVENGQFRGWIFRGWRDDRYSTTALLPGDIVLRVNGKPIERPDEFMKVWEDLRRASELAVELVRDGQPKTLRIPIRD